MATAFVLYCHTVIIEHGGSHTLLQATLLGELVTRWVMEGRGGGRGSLKMHCLVWVHGEGEDDKLVWGLGRNPCDAEVTSTVS